MIKVREHIIWGIAILGLLYANQGLAQWECRSHLAANLKPVVANSNLNWAGELVGSGGYLANNQIYSGMAFLAADYSIGNHQLYAEGGYKYWLQNEGDAGYQYSNGLFGLRELSYNFFSPKVEFNVGLHQMGLKDYMLVNERAWGTSMSTSVNGFDLDFNLATVTKDFSRNGTFCTNCFLYDLIPTRNYPAGNAFGETNFAALSFSKKVGSGRTDSPDEFESFGEHGGDDFESFDSDGEFSSFNEVDASSKSSLGVDSYGGVVYTEFGSYYYQPQLYGGLFGVLKLGNDTKLKAEGLYQYATGNQALIAYMQLNHVKSWNTENTSSLSATFLGKVNIDDNALAMPRFSNLFFGEVFRMDAIDLPLMNVALKHQFSKHQLSLKAQYSQQFAGTHMQEFDFSVGQFLFDKKIRATLLTGIMKSDELDSWSNLARLEIRAFF